mmetsp:Transcript_674/g.1459  ORF Transcript_674/g.1459 Transcript_674/m.1459 type:complete len:235 (+) Transcript_674:632-1336(+)
MEDESPRVLCDDRRDLLRHRNNQVRHQHRAKPAQVERHLCECTVHKILANWAQDSKLDAFTSPILWQWRRHLLAGLRKRTYAISREAKERQRKLKGYGELTRAHPHFCTWKGPCEWSDEVLVLHRHSRQDNVSHLSMSCFQLPEHSDKLVRRRHWGVDEEPLASLHAVNGHADRYVDVKDALLLLECPELSRNHFTHHGDPPVEGCNGEHRPQIPSRGRRSHFWCLPFHCRICG